MASRQNREMRAEYPTGHNKGNESPSRRVPRNPGGANPVEPPTERGRAMAEASRVTGGSGGSAASAGGEGGVGAPDERSIDEIMESSRVYGAPMGVPEVDESRDAERERKLATTPKPGEASEAIETHIQAGIDETKRAELETQADARTGAREPGPTEDLSAAGAAKKLQEHKRRTEEAGR